MSPIIKTKEGRLNKFVKKAALKTLINLTLGFGL